MKSVITIIIAIFFSVSTMAAPANLFSSIPATTKSETKSTETKVRKTQSDEQSLYFPDYKILQKGMKRLEYQYHLFA